MILYDFRQSLELFKTIAVMVIRKGKNVISDNLFLSGWEGDDNDKYKFACWRKIMFFPWNMNLLKVKDTAVCIDVSQWRIILTKRSCVWFRLSVSVGNVLEYRVDRYLSKRQDKELSQKPLSLVYGFPWNHLRTCLTNMPSVSRRGLTLEVCSSVFLMIGF